MDENSRYLLLLACSERKSTQTGLVRAIDLYDGVNYQVLHKAQRQGYYPTTLHVLIVSAKYGLLDPETLIEHYDQRMTEERAQALQQQVGAALDAVLRAHHFDEVFVNMGQSYLLAVTTSQELAYLREQGRVRYASGGIGVRMMQMKNWLLHVAREGGRTEEN